MKMKNLSRYLVSILFIMILWYLTSMLLNTPVLPYPQTAIIEFVNVFPKLYIHILYSLQRIISALVISIVIGVPAGLIMGRYRKLDYFFTPIVYLIYPIPKIAFLPVVMLLFGIGNFSKIFLIFITVFFQIIVTCRDESVKIREELFYFMRSIGSSQFNMFYHLVFPYSLPAIFTSIRLCLGTSIAILFFLENFGTDWGIGYFIVDSWMRVNYKEMFAGIIALSLMGILLFLFVDILEQKLCPWVS